MPVAGRSQRGARLAERTGLAEAIRPGAGVERAAEGVATGASEQDCLAELHAGADSGMLPLHGPAVRRSPLGEQLPPGGAAANRRVRERSPVAGRAAPAAR